MLTENAKLQLVTNLEMLRLVRGERSLLKITHQRQKKWVGPMKGGSYSIMKRLHIFRRSIIIFFVKDNYIFFLKKNNFFVNVEATKYLFPRSNYRFPRSRSNYLLETNTTEYFDEKMNGWRQTSLTSNADTYSYNTIIRDTLDENAPRDLQPGASLLGGGGGSPPPKIF